MNVPSVHAMTSPLPLREMGPAAAAMQSQGFDGLVLTETGRTAFTCATAAALATEGFDLATGVAVAFPRSPMVTAAAAWELAEATGGRFRLGLGTQVKAHIVRRYSSEFAPPGPRLREYVQALRAIFAAFRGTERLAFSGDFWEFSLLPGAWSPGPIEADDPPIDVAAVNPWMLRMAGEVADGVHVHPLNTPTYLGSTVQDELESGLSVSGRSRDDLQVFVPCFTVVGDDEAERERWRALARAQVGFYGSTPNYAFIFEQIGADEVGPALTAAMREGDMARLTSIVDDEVLAHFVVESDWAGLPAALRDRYQGHADRVVLYFANPALADPATMERFGDVAARMG